MIQVGYPALCCCGSRWEQVQLYDFGVISSSDDFAAYLNITRFAHFHDLYIFVFKVQDTPLMGH